MKETLILASFIQAPDWSLPFEFMCDASDYAIRAVLGQRKGKKMHAIYYVSKTLDDAHINYATIEKELLAVAFAMDKFRPYLVGSRVIVYMDHTTLKYMLNKKDAKLRLILWNCFSKNLVLRLKTRKVLKIWLLTTFQDYAKIKVGTRSLD